MSDATARAEAGAARDRADARAAALAQSVVEEGGQASSSSAAEKSLSLDLEGKFVRASREAARLVDALERRKASEVAAATRSVTGSVVGSVRCV